MSSNRNVRLFSSDRRYIGEVSRADAHQKVNDNEAVWFKRNCIREVVADLRGKSCQPGPRSIEGYAEARSACLYPHNSESVASVEEWAIRGSV